MTPYSLDDQRKKLRRNGVLFWLAGLFSAYVVFAGFLKALFVSFSSAGPLGQPFARLTLSLAQYIYGWPIARDIWTWAPSLDLHDLVNASNIGLMALYVLTIFLLGQGRSQFAQARRLGQLKAEAKEESIRRAYRGESGDWIYPEEAGAPKGLNGKMRAVPWREKLHDYYFAPLIVGVILLLIQAIPQFLSGVRPG